ncbi:MAG: DNA topoisomerase IB [Catenulisporales bacterium]|nr:DNA topoisomerase IB [Catenulisporales bacterium]
MAQSSGRLRRARPDRPGLVRVRHGRGFRYLDADGGPAAEQDVWRAKELVIPPAWRDVWICPWPNGHIQATGTDDAGRRQYLYHPRWREQRDRLKHDHVLEFAAELPALRQRIEQALYERGLSRPKVLGAAIRMLDLGLFRVGGRQYAIANGSHGLATLERSHLSFEHGEAVFRYPAKGGAERVQRIADPVLVKVLRALHRRSGGGDRLLAYYNGRGWHEVTDREINEHLKTLAGPDASAKDFRTWHATVLVAVALAVSNGLPDSRAARRRAVARAIAEAADYLGNTPAVCRASYVDPRVIDRYLDGETIDYVLPALGRDTEQGVPATHGAAEQAVLRLLDHQNGRQ